MSVRRSCSGYGNKKAEKIELQIPRFTRDDNKETEYLDREELSIKD